MRAGNQLSESYDSVNGEKIFHIPVMLNEVIEGLNIKEEGKYFDGTSGFLGHSQEIIKRLNKNGIIILVDKDKDAIKYIENKIKELRKNSNSFPKVIIRHGNFKNIKSILEEENIEELDGALLDLGVSSFQLDDKSRGFSYINDCMLDMRMNKDEELNAKTIVNEYDEEDLVNIFFKYGEEKFSKRIASEIVRCRNEKKIETTKELVDIIESAVPAKFRKKGFKNAKRIFQSLRIEVNKELEILEESILNVVSSLKKTGRFCVISFNSLEDRIVKRTFVNLTKKGSDELNEDCLGVVVKKINKKPLVSSEEELALNMRAKPAKLRIVERVS